MYSILVTKSYFKTEIRYTAGCSDIASHSHSADTRHNRSEQLSEQMLAAIGGVIAVGLPVCIFDVNAHTTYIYTHTHIPSFPTVHLPLSQLHLARVDKYRSRRFSFTQRHHILLRRSHIISLDPRRDSICNSRVRVRPDAISRLMTNVNYTNGLFARSGE